MHRSINNTIYSVSYNGGAYFASATEDGAKIYTLEPKLYKHIDASAVGSLQLIDVHDSADFIAMVGGGQIPMFDENTACIWDDTKAKFTMTYHLTSQILSLKLFQNRLIVCSSIEITLFEVSRNPSKLVTFETGYNPLGLFAISPLDIWQTSPLDMSEQQILLTPTQNTGEVKVIDLNGLQKASPGVVKAHQSDLAYLALNHRGKLFATASIRGTLIRVFDSVSKDKLLEFRRGLDQVQICCLNFCKQSKFLCASSERHTVHIFELREMQAEEESYRINSQSGISRWFGYTDNKSFAKFKVPENAQNVQNLYVMDEDYKIKAICMDGYMYCYSFRMDGKISLKRFCAFKDLEEDEVYVSTCML